MNARDVWREPPDTDYDTEASLRRIEAKIDALEKGKADK